VEQLEAQVPHLGLQPFMEVVMGKKRDESKNTGYEDLDKEFEDRRDSKDDGGDDNVVIIDEV
jgi:hypothetical protein